MKNFCQKVGKWENYLGISLNNLDWQNIYVPSLKSLEYKNLVNLNLKYYIIYFPVENLYQNGIPLSLLSILFRTRNCSSYPLYM